MPVPYQFLRHQGPVIAGLVHAARPHLRKRPPPPSIPGPVLHREVAPRPDALLDAYQSWCGASPDESLPPHFFPQWGFPLQTRVLDGLPYPLTKLLNGGCRLEVFEPLGRGQALQVQAQLLDVDDTDTKVTFPQRLTTRTAAGGHIEAVTTAILPRRRKNGPRRAKPTVPMSASPIATRTFTAADGRSFAAITGDVNPIHWLPFAARAAGFKHTILHGFGMFGWTWEALSKSGDPRVLDVRFEAPLVLPATVHLFVEAQQLWLGTAVGAPAFLTGRFDRG